MLLPCESLRKATRTLRPRKHAIPRTALKAARRHGWSLLLGLLAAFAPCLPAQAQQAAPAQRIDGGAGACSSLAIAATGPAALAVAWVSDGTTPTLMLRERVNLLWNAPLELPALGRDPRDVALAFDARGRLHVAWTALLPQGRAVLHAVRPEAAEPFELTPLAPCDTADTSTTTGLFTNPEEPGAADFPVIEPDAAGGVLIAWQETRPLQLSIHAAQVSPEGEPRSLGRISSTSVSGMTPTILATQPPQVAWYELQPIGGELRVDAWDAASERWRPASAERGLAPFPRNNQVLLRPTPQGVVGAWPEWGGEAPGALHVALAPATDPLAPPAEVAPAFSEDLRDQPPGDHATPSLAGTLPGRLTACWQAFSAGRQTVVISSFFGSAPDGQPAAAALTIELSPETQRFASLPAHATHGDWSAAVWTDDARDGGDGGVYLAELAW